MQFEGKKIAYEIDQNTGEVITVDLWKQKQSKQLKPNFIKVYKEFFEILLLLKGSEPRVLAWLIINANKSNFIKISYKQLAKKVSLTEAMIKKIMSNLKKHNLVINKQGIIYINPSIVSKAKGNTDTIQFEYMPLFNKELQ